MKLPTLATLFLLSLLAAPADAAAPAGNVEVFGNLWLGPLSPPAPGPAGGPAEIALRFLRDLWQKDPGLVPAPDSLSAPEVVPLGNGHAVRLRQVYRGVPVLGSAIVLRLGPDGQVLRLVRDVLPPEALQALDLTPALAADDARDLVRSRSGSGGVHEPVLHIDLQSGRLVWAVLSIDLSRLDQPENALYLIDAQRGRLLRRMERIQTFDNVRVYHYNPIEEKVPAVLPIPADFSPAMAAPRTLTSGLLQAFSCLDEQTTRPIQGKLQHACVPRQLAVASGSNDFDSYNPLALAADGKCPLFSDTNRNEFGEAHMYYHAAIAYGRFRSHLAALGRPDFKLLISTGAAPQPFPLEVSVCQPEAGFTTDVRRRLVALNNALYSPAGLVTSLKDYAGQSTDHDVIAFGMGPKSSYAMDADVVYHEFTHAAQASLGHLNLSYGDDGYGRSTDPGALNEALADYFSSTLTGDPGVGEYAGLNFGTSILGVRRLDNQDRCAEGRVGEIHLDSTPFSGALWQARTAIAGDPMDQSMPASTLRNLFDQAVLAALLGLHDFPSMTAYAKVLRQEVQLRAGLGADADAKLTRAMTDHGVLPLCDRVIRDLAPKPTLCMPGVDVDGNYMIMPGWVQWRVDVPASADTIDLKFQTARIGPCPVNSVRDEPQLKLAVRRGETPVTWKMDEGSYDQLLDIDSTGTNWEKKLKAAPGTYHLMIVNKGGSIVGRNIAFTTLCENTMGCSAAADLGGGAGGGADLGGAEDLRQPGGHPAGGCDIGAGARPADAPGGFGLCFLLLGLLLFCRNCVRNHFFITGICRKSAVNCHFPARRAR